MKIANIGKYMTMLGKFNFPELSNLVINFPCYFYRTLMGTRYIEKRVNDYRMLLDFWDAGISRALFLYGTREKDHIIILGQELKVGMTVLDLGANIGYYSIMMGKMVGPSGKIYAVEPSLSNYFLLNLNIKLNDLEDVVERFNIGISNETGTGKFYQSEKSNLHTFYPKVHSGDKHESLTDVTPVDVPIMTIGDFKEGRRNIDLIRMDIEGFEVEVFDSMISLLKDKDFKPMVLFEVHQPRYDDKEHNMRKCLTALFDEGYYVKALASNLHEDSGEKIFGAKGYKPEEVIKTDGMKRGLFYNISNDDAMEFMCDADYTRTVLLKRK